MMTPEPVSETACVPKPPLCWPLTSIVTTLGPIVAAALSGVPVIVVGPFFTVPPASGVELVRVPLLSSWKYSATPPPAAPPATSASAISAAVPGRRDGFRAAGAGSAGGSDGGVCAVSGRTAVVPGCDHQGASGI